MYTVVGAIYLFHAVSINFPNRRLAACRESEWVPGAVPHRKTTWSRPPRGIHAPDKFVGSHRMQAINLCTVEVSTESWKEAPSLGEINMLYEAKRERGEQRGERIRF